MFSLFDTDNNGTISAKEMKAGFAAIGERLEGLESDAPGTVWDFVEFVETLAERSRSRMTTPQATTRGGSSLSYQQEENGHSRQLEIQLPNDVTVLDTKNHNGTPVTPFGKHEKHLQFRERLAADKLAQHH